MRSIFFVGTVLVCSLLAKGAGAEEFRFPGGNPDDGKEAFEKFNCTQCHLVSGAKLAKPEKTRRLSVSLGTEQRFVKNYGDIVKAITNPKHVVKERYAGLLSLSGIEGEITALMPNFSEKMTVRELMDLAAFLDKAYRDGMDSYGKIDLEIKAKD